MSAAAGDVFFIDTNLLLYALDPRDPEKHLIARRWMDQLWLNGAGRVSWQVLNEFFANAERKLRAPGTDARKTVEELAGWRPPAFDLGLVKRAWYWIDHASISYWDALILAAAEAQGCRWLLSE